MSDIDTRMARDSVEALSEEERFWALMAPAWDNSRQGTRGQRALACVTYFVRDVDNGGLDQAIGNRDKTGLDEVRQALTLLGAKDHVELLDRAEVALLGASLPASMEARQSAIDRRSREWLDEHIEPLNEQFYGEEWLHPYFREYVARHPEEFYR